MDFFKNKWVKLVAWILLALSVIVLVIGGATTEVLTKGVVLTVAIVAAVSAVVAFICEQLKNDK